VGETCNKAMAFRSVNLNPPRGPRGGGGGGGRGGGSYRGGGNSGYNTPPLRIDASGRVDQGFGPVGGATADDFDIFGIDEPSALQNPQPAPTQPILYASPPCPLHPHFPLHSTFVRGLCFRSSCDQWSTMITSNVEFECSRLFLIHF